MGRTIHVRAIAFLDKIGVMLDERLDDFDGAARRGAYLIAGKAVRRSIR